MSYENMGSRLKFIGGAAAGLILFLFLIVALFLPDGTGLSWGVGYLLGVATIALHLILTLLVKNINDEAFFRFYFLGMVLRFVLVLVLYVAIIISGKFDQIIFTVSFIISYLFHSVIEIILINKKLTNRTR